MQILHLYGYNIGVKFWEQMGAALVQLDKVVNVRMSESEYTLLKAYCASPNRSMQNVLRDFSLMEIQKQHNFCRIVRSLMEEYGVDQDARAKKPCAGYSCYYAVALNPARLAKLICYSSPAKNCVKWIPKCVHIF